MLNVRVATADDADTISTLNREVHNLHATALPYIFKQASHETFPPEEITKILADPDSRIFVAYWDEEPGGYLYCQIRRREESAATHARDQVYIHHVSVNRSHQRKGIGTALFRAVTDLANELGIRRLGLDVWSFNQDAITFFETQGFKMARQIMTMDL